MPRIRLAKVDCYSGHTYAQEPRAFVLGLVRRTVVAVVGRSREPKGPVFAVTANDGYLYQLRYDEAEDTWTASRTRQCSGAERASESHFKGGDQG
jgi:hypothetical protein